MPTTRTAKNIVAARDLRVGDTFTQQFTTTGVDFDPHDYTIRFVELVGDEIEVTGQRILDDGSLSRLRTTWHLPADEIVTVVEVTR